MGQCGLMRFVGLRVGFALALIAVVVCPALAASAPTRVTVDLVADVQAVPAGGTFWVALRQQIEPGWHTYWTNPGDSGEPVQIDWQLPDGITAGEVTWPAPERIPVGPAMSYGYTGEVALPIPMTAPGDLAPGARVTLRGQARWLVCEKICIPEEQPLALTLPVVAGPAPADPRGAPMIEAARRAAPAASPWPASFTATDELVTLRVAARSLAREHIAEVWFYPLRWGLIEHAAPQRSRVDAGGITLEVARGPLPEAAAGPIDGVLVVTERLDGGVARQAFSVRAGAAAPASAVTLLGAAALALAGGLVLNLMPCVLPVLAVKTLGLVQHAGGRAALLRAHGLAYTAGVLASFAVVAGALLALRAGGEQLGWGFQLQSPVFVTLLAYLFFTLALSLSGAIVIGGRLLGVGGALAGRSGYAGSFFTGALATVAATPCTAPFMGVAVGFAVTQSWPRALLIFEALALGLALPYLALTLVPAWRRFLPQPGAWMERLQQLLAFPLFATVAWLVWVVSQQAGPHGLAAALAGLVVIAFAAWLHRISRHVGVRQGQAARIAVTVLVVGAVTLGALAGAGRTSPRAPETAGWEPFSTQRLAEARAAGKPVFVNVTAAWCITCLVNERVALRSTAVADAFARNAVVKLKADWTTRDPAITTMLGRFGRSGVPLYLFYPPDATAASGEAIVLPQILSEGLIIDAIERKTL
jgi:thiol:disulfide interchange protein DsbD